MHGNSRTVESPQHGCHPALARLDLPAPGRYRCPPDPAGEALFARADAARAGFDGLILDHACGNGESTRWLARARPAALVVGVERSPRRLAAVDPDNTGWARHGNAVFLRTDCVGFWQLARRAGWRADAQFFLYPTPWPKPRHLRRRWHAHPAFGEVLAMGGRLELRTNWPVYAQEFAAVLNAGVTAQRPAQVEPYRPAMTITAFERKYHDSGQTLYRVVADTTAAGDH